MSVDEQIKQMAERAAQWASSAEGQEAAKQAVKHARETVKPIKESQRVNPTKSCKFVV